MREESIRSTQLNDENRVEAVLFNNDGLPLPLMHSLVHGKIHLLLGGCELPNDTGRGKNARHYHTRADQSGHHTRLDETEPRTQSTGKSDITVLQHHRLPRTEELHNSNPDWAAQNKLSPIHLFFRGEN